MTPVLLLVLAVILTAFGALMAAIDAALSVTSRQDLSEAAGQGKNSDLLRRIAADPDTHENAVIFIRVLAETTAAVLVTVSFTMLIQNVWWAMLGAAVLMTGISFVVVGASPRSVGRRHSRSLLTTAAPIIRGARIVLGPLAHALVALGDRVTPGASRGASFDSEEQLLSMLDEAADHDLIEEDDRDLIHSVFDFTDTYVRAVMIPHTDMVTLPAQTPTREAIALFLEKGVSRIPLLRDERDDVQGVLYLKDLVQFAFRDEAQWAQAPVGPLARRPVFVPESMKAETLLQQMKRDAVHVCLVVDEYGGISGLVTLEDLLEELVGEIADEYDPRVEEVVELEPGRYRVSARLSLDSVGDLFGLDLEDDDVDSVGGLLSKALGRVPQPGARAERDGLVLVGGTSRGRGRGLDTVFVERAQPPADAEEIKEDDSAASAEHLPTTDTGAVRIPKTKGKSAKRRD
ncbi:CBS domain containing-hemolysin-like protein [Microbacterium endophyticum]|uniref:CBS domain containing-hemolysin-like protein n=1 Tax=Microbacterium endophyticum TaxID=1526412 RepID=A0A7W4YKW0_9MICO|nr:hemolysin family protein [Microbacterium endophyticum]MBB2974513.1 CBS domain containing-hemolysin-like protein [Microbacterium endophyticum]NIK36810.1 CBS domain containing-hemolysin-like protein [Microbacterium endophyticum]